VVDVPAPGLLVAVGQRIGDVIGIDGGDEAGGHAVLHERDEVVPYGAQALLAEPRFTTMEELETIHKNKNRKKGRNVFNK